MTKQQPVATAWQKAIKPGDIVVDVFQPDREMGETRCHVGYSEIMPWSESITDEFGGGLDPETHARSCELGGGPPDENITMRNRIEAILTPSEAAGLAAAEWPTTLHDLLNVVRKANQ